MIATASWPSPPAGSSSTARPRQLTRERVRDIYGMSEDEFHGGDAVRAPPVAVI